MAENNGAGTAPARERQVLEAAESQREKRVADLRDQYSRREYQVDAHELAAHLMRAHFKDSRER